MTAEQIILRICLLAPSLVLIMAFLPYKGGGYQWLGIIDPDFLLSRAIDFTRLIWEATGLLILWLLLELYARNSLNYFPIRDEDGLTEVSHESRQS